MIPPGSEIPQLAVQTAKVFLEKIAGSPLDEIGQLLADKVRFWRYKNMVRIILKAEQFVHEAGINPKRIPPKVLFPILEAGSLEEEETMQDKWATLLANAVSQDTNRSIESAFPEILKELSPGEALILDKMYDEKLMISLRLAPDKKLPFSEENINQVKTSLTLVVLEHFLKLGLCTMMHTDSRLYFLRAQWRKFQIDMGRRLYPTALGIAFVCACRGPKKEQPRRLSGLKDKDQDMKSSYGDRD